MKSLKELGRKITLYKGYDEGKVKIVECPCGSHSIFKASESMMYVDCVCGKRVRICKKIETLH